MEDPIEMERLADENADRAHTRFITSDDPEEIAAGIRRYVDLGFDELILHAPGEDQARFLEQFGEDVLPLAARLGCRPCSRTASCSCRAAAAGSGWRSQRAPHVMA